MTKITCIVNTPTSIVSMYRSSGVFPRLRESMPDLKFEYKERIDWRDLVDMDILFLQRPCNGSDIEAIRQAKQVGIPVWVDADDYDLDVPKGNPRYELFNSLSVKRHIETAFRMADVVTVSTEALKEKLLELNSMIEVIPNASNEKWFPMKAPVERANMVVWRGGPSHVEDLMAYEKDIAELTFSHRETQFIFMGDPYWHTLEICNPENTRRMPPEDVLQYMKTLHALGPKVVMVPLKDSAFNRCKSNIVWIEASFAGAAVVAPDWNEWQKPGVINYSPLTFKAAVSNALWHDQRKWVEASQNFIDATLTLSKVNRMRDRVILKLLG